MKEPIKESVKARGHTAQYQMHKYFARRPYNVFRNLIEHYTEKGDVVLDCFCGGGVTVFESLTLERKAVGVDINPLATFITEMQLQQVDAGKLKKYFDRFLAECREEYGALYQYAVAGKKVEMEWMEWVYEVTCSECGAVIRLTEDRKISNGKYRCANPDCPSNHCDKAGVVRTSCAPYRSVPVRMKCHESGMYVFDEAEREDIIRKFRKFDVSSCKVRADAPIPHNWDRWYEDCLPQKGVLRFSDLFSERNYYINTKIFNKILELEPSQYRDLLYFAFSASLRYTNKMSRITRNWENGNPTCMDKHAYWLPNEYVECNVLDKLEGRMAAVIRGLKYTASALHSPKRKAESFEELAAKGDYMILTRSAEKLPLPDESVSAVITDPPYGSNVQYGELSSFWNVWYREYRGFDRFIYNEQEAVSNRKSCYEGAKDTAFYGEMLQKVFTEAGRVLKPDGYLVFTFQNKNINVWIQMLKAVVNAGFYLPEDGVIYQDFIKEYQNTSHLRYSGNVHGDFIYSFRKGRLPDRGAPAGDFSGMVKRTVGECLNSMYADGGEYTTTELYEKIFGKLTGVILQFVCQEEEQVEKLDELSETFIDHVLSQSLELRDGKWRRKGGVRFADGCD